MKILFNSIVFLLIFLFIFLLFSVDYVGHGVMGEPGEGREDSLPRFTIIIIVDDQSSIKCGVSSQRNLSHFFGSCRVF